MTASASTSAREIAAIAAGFSLAGARSLDLDSHLAAEGRGEPSAPLELPGGQLDLIYSLASMARLREEWQRWLPELNRVLAPGGLLVIAIPLEKAEALSGAPRREWLALSKREDGDGPAPDRSEAPGGLSALFERLDSEALRAVDGVRESFDRELGRKAFRIAELELGAEPTPSMWAYGERVAATYEASLSWRVTRPLRAAGRLVGRR